ncbi:hypothetical protein ACFPVT_09750 [Corynebacterium choanae]|uniref:Uncharacterized protein n=1 Tax=Corynebacterium choanae TaxID=1862358 RepID=A0A3G6J8I5_9CORY|nr:hypothetical protein CCHOA_09180 [Corynebacterium choanae]
MSLPLIVAHGKRDWSYPARVATVQRPALTTIIGALIPASPTTAYCRIAATVDTPTMVHFERH